MQTLQTANKECLGFFACPSSPVRGGRARRQFPRMKFNRIKKITYYGIIGLLALVGLLVVISAFPITGNYQIKVVQSGSMEPSIKVGSVVVVKPSESYEAGDVITYEGGFRDERGGRIPVTHRIVEKKTEGGSLAYVTKGDANDDPDNRVVRERQIIGKVLFDVPYMGYIVEAARKPYGFLAIIIIPAAIIVYDQVEVIWREVKRMYGKKKKDNELAKEQELNL